jgi:hypothetical protein
MSLLLRRVLEIVAVLVMVLVMAATLLALMEAVQMVIRAIHQRYEPRISEIVSTEYVCVWWASAPMMCRRT